LRPSGRSPSGSRLPANHQSLQQFLADSPWDPELVVRAGAERVPPWIAVEAWVLDDTGFPKDGVRPPESIARLIERSAPEKLKTVAFRDGTDGEQASSRFAFLRVRDALLGWLRRRPELVDGEL